VQDIYTRSRLNGDISITVTAARVVTLKLLFQSFAILADSNLLYFSALSNSMCVFSIYRV